MASTALAVSPQPAARATDPAFDGDAPGAATVRAAIEAELRARDVFSTLPPVEELMEALHARLLADSADVDALLPHRTLVMQTAVACQRRLQAEERSEAALRELANLDPAVAAAAAEAAALAAAVDPVRHHGSWDPVLREQAGALRKHLDAAPRAPRPRVGAGRYAPPEVKEDPSLLPDLPRARAQPARAGDVAGDYATARALTAELVLGGAFDGDGAVPTSLAPPAPSAALAAAATLVSSVLVAEAPWLLPQTDAAASDDDDDDDGDGPLSADQASDFDDEPPPAVRYAADPALALAPLASSGRPEAAAADAGGGARHWLAPPGEARRTALAIPLREFCRRHAALLGADAETLEQMLEHVAQGKRKDWRGWRCGLVARAPSPPAAPPPQQAKRKMEQPPQRFVEARPAEPRARRSVS